MVSLRMVSTGLCFLFLLLFVCVGCGDGGSQSERCGSAAEGEGLEANDCIGSRITGSVTEGGDDDDTFFVSVPNGIWTFELSWNGTADDLDFYLYDEDDEEIAAGASEFDNPETVRLVFPEAETVRIDIVGFDTNFEEREYVFTYAEDDPS